jgi:hypothetical protein
MESSTRNKRSASNDPTAHVAKRARVEEEDPSSPTTDDDNADYSVESLLSVPLSVIFRHVPNSAHPRPLLTRAEAQCFLQVNLLAHELDVMVQLSEQTLGQQLWCRQLGGELLKYSNSNPYLRPLSTMLTLHQQQQQQTCPRVVASALDRMLQSLAGCATTLRQSSEQNWTLSESLIDALEGAIGGGGQVLAQEKKRLAELEEEVCSRVERLLETHQNQNSNEKDDILVVEPTLRTVCNSIWGDDLILNLNLKDEESSSSSSSTLTNNKKETSEAASTTTTVPTTTKEDIMPPPPPQESTVPPAPKDTMHPPPFHESTKDPIAAALPPAHEASSFSYPTQNSLPTKTQPEYRKDDGNDDDDDDDEDSDDEHIPDPHQESQNSFLKKSSAAEALAVLAVGRPAINHSL